MVTIEIRSISIFRWSRGDSSGEADRSQSSIDQGGETRSFRKGASFIPDSASLAVVLLFVVFPVLGACSLQKAAPPSRSCANTAAIANPEQTGLAADCETLLIVKESLTGADSLNWSVDIPLSNWDGVVVAQNRVTELDFAYYLMEGVIPAELSRLAELEYLDLTENRLEGRIPAELGQLTNLKSLFLFGNQLAGRIPIELGQLTNLEHLDLSSNQLEGRVPTELGQLKSLRWLQLAGNQLEGGIPAELSKLSNLEHLGLDGNQLELEDDKSRKGPSWHNWPVDEPEMVVPPG